ncbi:hypothetical protein NF681_19835 (plasmid) [Comamonadaceae bacterium OTU4NAUVB1]|jgi:hypothetical protein|nr:hypothetical protein NF681_19835 [Comamonadaceae bacterium OTU4NAUVB1]
MAFLVAAFHSLIFRWHWDVRTPSGFSAMQFLLPVLQLKWLQRFVFVVVLGTFLPVTIAAAACQIHCTMEQKTDADSLQENSHEHEFSTGLGLAGSKSDHAGDNSSSNVSDHLQHPGACHLAHVPGLDGALTESGILKTTSGWMNQVMVNPSSCTWPPPRHPPRT